ncbi:MAG: hypothetical protein J6P16_00835 [Eubacterium sp.]|nr:hypothetical protein [Eubacterium sp.]
MINSITADLIRVQKKKSFFIMVIIQCLLIVGLALFVMYFPTTGNRSNNFYIAVGAGAGLSSLLIAIPVFLAVFSDDFRSHAMQTAIGFGLSRTKLIVARYLEALVLIAECCIYINITELVMGMIANVDMKTIGELCKDTWISLTPTMCYVAISMLIVYSMQSATFALVMYIIFNTGVISGILAGISAVIPFIRKNNIHLEWILPDQLINGLALNPEYNYGYAIWGVVVIVFILIPVWLSTVIFKNKELEF